MDMRGHNSAAFNQTLAELAEAVGGKAAKKRFPYFKFYPRDWLEATRGMSLEERGAYIDFICLFMESEGDLADDDNWIRHQMHVPKQRWKKMKTALIGHGKISIHGDRLINERCLRELDELMAKSAQNSKNIQKRWKKVGEKVEESSNFVGTFSSEKSKKSNKINEPDDTNVSRHARVTTDTDSDLEEESPNGLLSSGDGQSDGRMTASKAAKIAFDLYNETAERCGLPKCKILNESRKRSLALRVKEAGGIDGFKRALANLEKSAYCQGQNDRGWVATIDYVCQPKGFAKLFEGGWGNGAHASIQPKTANDAWFDKMCAEEGL